jgi:sigma-B regulation protein RsbU (phosphoserine phosphatase)
MRNGDTHVELPDQPNEEFALILDGFNSIIKSSKETVRIHEEKASKLDNKNRELLGDLEKTYDDYTAISESYEHLSRHMGVTDAIMKKTQSDKGENIRMTGLIQSGFIPKYPPELTDWEIRFIFKQAGIVSGDMFDFFHVDDLVGIFLIDVSGSDIGTGLMTIIAKRIIRHSFIDMRDKKLNVVIDSINAEFQKQFKLCEKLIKGVFLRFNADKIEYVNAGHPDVLCYTPRSGTVIPVKPRDYVIKGSILGYEEIKSPYEVIHFTMNKGDCLFFYSDSLIVSRNRDREEYGIDRVVSSITAAARSDNSTVVELVAQDFFQFTGTEELADDLTIISIKRLK